MTEFLKYHKKQTNSANMFIFLKSDNFSEGKKIYGDYGLV